MIKCERCGKPADPEVTKLCPKCLEEWRKEWSKWVKSVTPAGAYRGM